MHSLSIAAFSRPHFLPKTRSLNTRESQMDVAAEQSEHLLRLSFLSLHWEIPVAMVHFRFLRSHPTSLPCPSFCGGNSKGRHYRTRPNKQ